jgi:Pentapeptide repeats (8 copies)
MGPFLPTPARRTPPPGNVFSVFFGGERFQDCPGANLSGANLSGANLYDTACSIGCPSLSVFDF